MVLSAEVDTRQFDRMVKFWPRKSKLALGDALDHISLKFLKEFKRQRLKGSPGIMGHPRGIFSTFNRSFLVSSSVRGMGVMIFSNSKVAQLHETGGIVRNPSGGKLAVPLSARTQMFTARGKLRKKYRDPRNLKNVFPQKINSKIFLLKRKRGSDDVEPLYVLKNQVRLKARLGFFKVWDSMENFRIRRINKAIDEVFRSV